MGRGVGEGVGIVVGRGEGRAGRGGLVGKAGGLDGAVGKGGEGDRLAADSLAGSSAREKGPGQAKSATAR